MLSTHTSTRSQFSTVGCTRMLWLLQVALVAGCTLPYGTQTQQHAHTLWYSAVRSGALVRVAAVVL
jgi:hypothetical protein